MEEIEKLKEDIIQRYELSWSEAHVIDNMGLIQACKDNFRELVEQLIELCQTKL